MADQPNLRTPLDEAIEDVREDSSFANFFYDTFLNTDIFVPVEIVGQIRGTWRKLGLNESFHPLFITYQNTKVIPVFDRLERLQDWAQGKALDYMQIRCHLLLKMVSPGVAIILNSGLSSSHYFSTEVLDQLRQAMKPVSVS